MPKYAPKRLNEKLLSISENFGDSQGLLKRLENPEAILQISISAYERGKQEPPLLILLEYARLEDVPVDVLIDDSLDLVIKKK